MRSLIVIATASCVAAAWLSQAAAEPPKPLLVEEELLGPMPEKPELVFYSPDGRRMAAVVASEGRKALWVDGKLGAGHDAIQVVSFSPDGTRYAYVAVNGKKSLVVVDGRPGPECDEIIPITLSFVQFSPDSARVAYIARNEGKAFAVVDGEPGPEFDMIMPLTFAFSPDSKHTAYVAMDEGKTFVVADGRRGPAFGMVEAVARPVMGPAGMRETRPGIAFSPDGRRIAYAARGQDMTKCFVVVDGEACEPHDAIGMSSIAFSPDGKHVGYVAIDVGGQRAVVDGRAGPAYELIMDLALGADGRAAYSARKDKKWRVVAGGEESPEYDVLLQDALAISPDGKRLAYPALRDGRFVMVVDGKPGPEFSRPAWPVFSRDSKRLAYLGEGQRRLPAVILDGRQGPEFISITMGFPIFTPDGAHFIYTAMREDMKYVIVVDDRVAVVEDVFLPGLSGTPATLADGTFECLVERPGRMLWRVRVTP